MSLLLICIFIISCIHSCHGEYHIKDGNIPSYMYHKFSDIEEEIFPFDLKINISLTRISGTLMYSIDRNMNQLIITLNNYNVPMLYIEFRTQINTVFISKLCECELCRYEILALRIQIRQSISLFCNKGSEYIILFKEIKELNKNYPIAYIYSDTSTKIKSPNNEAHLWLVNRPQYESIYPNQDQLSGCIFNISYNNHPIIFQNISVNIEGKCKDACRNKICHDGDCLETYESVPVCNCTKTLLNGPYCDKAMVPMNIRTLSQIFQFDKFKVSWISSAREILKLENRNVGIRLYRRDQILTFELNLTHGAGTRLEEKITTRYQPNKKAVCIVSFYEAFVSIHFINNGCSYDSNLAVNRNLRRELFDSLTLRSGNGTIDMVYKTNEMDVQWSKLVLRNTTSIVNELSITPKNNTSDSEKSKQAANIVVIAIIILLSLVVPVVGGITIIRSCQLKGLYEKRNNDILKWFKETSKKNVENAEAVEELVKNCKATPTLTYKKKLQGLLNTAHKSMKYSQKLTKKIQNYSNRETEATQV